jgi:hypothetical protein
LTTKIEKGKERKKKKKKGKKDSSAIKIARSAAHPHN